MPRPRDEANALARSRVRVVGREVGFALAQGDEQQIDGGGLVSEHTFAVAAGGAAAARDAAEAFPHCSTEAWGHGRGAAADSQSSSRRRDVKVAPRMP